MLTRHGKELVIATPGLAARLRLPAVFCSAALLACVLAARPYSGMGICDDWSYVITAKKLAETGHVAYNGWATAMIGWQLYPAAWAIRLFGFSYTAARMTTLIAAMLSAFVMQRTFARAGVSERNAVLATLAVVLNPLSLQLSATFMTDTGGLFAIVLCLYACVRALQARADTSATAWICFAPLGNALFGSSRQIAWLGLLVMVPSTLWLMRGRRRVLLPAAAATLAGAAFVAWSLHWFASQPYALAEHLFFHIQGPRQALKMILELTRAALELPFLLLPLIAPFLSIVATGKGRIRQGLLACGVFYTAAALWLAHHPGAPALLQPMLGDWLGPQGFYGRDTLASPAPVVLGTPLRLFLTIVSLAGAYGFAALVARVRQSPLPARIDRTTHRTTRTLSWREIAILAGPFVLAYIALLVPRSAQEIFDRYLLGLEFVGALCLVKIYQQFVRPALPAWTAVLIGLIALFGIGSTHDLFALSRARQAITANTQAAGIAPQSLDGGFEYNAANELALTGYLNDPRLTNPPGLFHPTDPYRGMSCDGTGDLDDREPHLVPRYGIAFNPAACAGTTALPPVSYTSWLRMQSVTLYLVRYQPHGRAQIAPQAPAAARPAAAAPGYTPGTPAPE